LAIGTFVLAAQNRRLVKSAADEAALARDGLDLARAQNQTAEATLAAQTQPLLTSLPLGLIEEPAVVDNSGKVESTQDAGSIVVGVVSSGDNNGRILVPFRNVGTGLALVQSVWFWVGDGGTAGSARNTALPPDERTDATLSFSRESLWATEVYGRSRDFSVLIAYADVGGVSRGAVRLDIYRRERRASWYVRQVHFAATIEAVREAPEVSSAPVD
jgi:hypothetical protein